MCCCRGADRRAAAEPAADVLLMCCWCVAAACDPVFFVLQLVFAREKTCAEFTCVAAKDALADIQEKHRDIKKLERSIGQLHMPCNRCVIGHSFVSKH